MFKGLWMNIMDLDASKMLDKFTGFFTTISGDHRYTHEGLGYTYCGKTGNLADLASAESFQFTTPPSPTGNERIVHLRPPSVASVASAVEIRLAEGSTVTGGTAATAINKKRSKPDASLCVLKTGVTLSAEGLVIAQGIAGSSGAAQSVQGGSAGAVADKEIILKAATTYTLTIANLTATDTVAYYELDWYEEKQGG